MIEARLFPHPVCGKTVAGSHDTGLDEHEKQVFWLRGRSTGFALPSRNAEQWLMKRSSLVTAALPRGIYTRFPILLRQKPQAPKAI